jgi:transcriptional regulator with XRE-family HTH domain
MTKPSFARSLVERRTNLKLSVVELAKEEGLFMTSQRLEAIELGELRPTAAQQAAIELALRRLENQRGAMHSHSCICDCEVCERAGHGDFAVRAYAGGEHGALARLSDRVASILPSLIEPSKDVA